MKSLKEMSLATVEVDGQHYSLWDYPWGLIEDLRLACDDQVTNMVLFLEEAGIPPEYAPESYSELMEGEA